MSNAWAFKFIHWLALFWFWLYAAPAQAEDYPRQATFQNVMHSEDIALGEVEAIVQDHEGFMWLGGRNALLRYDGVEFLNVKITANSGPQPQLKTVNQVIDLFEDSRRQLWVATRSGLFTYDRASEHLIEATDKDHGPSSFAKNVVSSIEEAPNGEILLGSWNGLYIFDPTTREYRQFAPTEVGENGLSGLAIFDLVSDRANKVIWFATSKGLKRMDWHSKQILNFIPDPDNPDSISNNALKTIALDQQGDVWVGADNGLYRFNPGTQTFNHYVNNPAAANSLSDNIVRHITVGKNGWVWVGCQGGLNLFNRENNSFIRFLHDEGQPFSISSSITRRVYEDNNGDIWVGTYPSGVNFYDRTSDAMRVLKPHTDLNRGLLNKTVEAISEDQQGRLWIGAGGMTRYDLNSDTYVHYRNTGQNPGIATTEPINAHTDSAGDIWVGSWLNSFYCYNALADRFEQQPFDAQLASTKISITDKLPDNSVWSVYEDRQKNLWLGTHNAGLLLFDRAAQTYKVFAPIPGDVTSLSNAVVWNSFEDSKGRFWVGTAKGLNIMDRTAGTFKHYEANPQDPHQLANDSVLAIFEDHKGRLWFGTDAGLHLYREQSDDFALYGSAQGFVDVGIRTITQDTQGNLWLGTNNGIVMFNPDTQLVQNYIRYKGEKIGGTSTGASLTTKNGLVVIGSKNGLFIIDPRKLQINNSPPPIVFTELRIFTNKVAVNDEHAVLKRAINQTDEIVLDYKKNMLSLHFSALNFRSSEKNAYAYKLEGFDDDWRNVGNQRSALFTNLDAGTYTFRVRAANNDGVWNNEGRSMRIIQLPPPWRSWWAYSLYALAIIGMAGLFILSQFKKRRLIEEQSRLLEIKVAERTAQLHEKNSAIQAMLGNMRQGLFTLQLDGTVHPEYSRYLEDIFVEPEIAGKNGLNLLFRHALLGADVISQVDSALQSMLGEDETNYDCNVHLLVQDYEIALNSGRKCLSLDWSPILEGDIIVKMMVSVRDVTALRQMEREAQVKKRELDIIAQLINIPPAKYRALTESCSRFLHRNRTLIDRTTTRDPDVIAELFRNLHTIKGNCRIYDLSFLSEVVHQAEAQLSLLMNFPDEIWNRQKLLDDLTQVEAVFADYAQVVAHVFGRSEADVPSQTGVWLDNQAAHTLQQYLDALAAGVQPRVDKLQWAHLERIIHGAVGLSLEDTLADAIHALPSIAEQLNKPAPNIIVNAPAVIIQKGATELLANVFLHLLRNSIDHGIELPQVRTAQRKPPAGRITIEAWVEHRQLLIAIKDDGQGLDLLRLYAKGLKLGFWGEQAQAESADQFTPEFTQKIAELMFRPGVSTQEQLSEISGRGIGLDAVKQFLRERGGDIAIKLHLPQAPGKLREPGKIPFELIINLPEDVIVPSL